MVDADEDLHCLYEVQDFLLKNNEDKPDTPIMTIGLTQFGYIR